ncbi:MAG: hypothetical protein ABID38_06945, partial [Candidatus Diapherotrites archaeon]
MKKELLLVLLVMLSQLVTAQVIFEDDFDGLSQDYVCCNSHTGYNGTCDLPPGYTYFKSNGHDYGECNGLIIPEADRFGGRGENRGFRIHIEERTIPERDTQLTVELAEPQKTVYFRWYERNSANDLMAGPGDKLFRISNSNEEQIAFILWDPENSLPGIPVYAATASYIPAENIYDVQHFEKDGEVDFDLKTDVLPDTWHSYEIKIDIDGGSGELWVDGVSRGTIENQIWGGDWGIQYIYVGGNQQGQSWFEPQEEHRDYDDVTFSTEYIGPDECVDGDDISQSGACYCGGGPSPTDASNVYTSGYCCSGEWQAGFCDSSCVPSTEICDNGTD